MSIIIREENIKEEHNYATTSKNIKNNIGSIVAKHNCCKQGATFLIEQGMWV